MYFKEPNQLLDIFAQLEERNLFLIQNLQETEEELEDLRGKFQETKQQMESASHELESNIQKIREKITVEEEKVVKLREKAANLGKNGNNKHQNLLKELGLKVSRVFNDCGFDPEQTPDTLNQLMKIEELLEALISQLEEMPDQDRRKAEKLKEAERRERLRTEKVTKMEKEYEQRLNRYVERTKRVEERVKQQKRGKPHMFRSVPPRKKKINMSTVDKKKRRRATNYPKIFHIKILNKFSINFCLYIFLSKIIETVLLKVLIVTKFQIFKFITLYKINNSDKNKNIQGGSDIIFKLKISK
ncbi:hypothetical protein RFI_27893 [Reticulomyxa filosa]|uniref:ODAD1 central coiled coil region domain-containing protein n=1 Tax=Reticulomyxa filosa TaxID=46433 RepID=X6M665_RETFI|nr:hypothetical protein RFI_27893 [Reticulomyxa filosa]|eukprot:ETO09483.1 hypothetical protein RFI_27893 [Reticulomyxa filosa]